MEGRVEAKDCFACCNFWEVAAGEAGEEGAGRAGTDVAEGAEPEAADEEALPLALERPPLVFTDSATDIVTNSETESWKPKVVDSARRSLTFWRTFGSKRTSWKGDEAQKSCFLCLLGNCLSNTGQVHSFLAKTHM